MNPLVSCCVYTSPPLGVWFLNNVSSLKGWSWSQFYPSLSGFGKAQGEEAKKEVLSQVYDGLALLEGAYKEISKGKPFFGGDRIGYLDIALGSFLGWIRVTEAMAQIKLIGEEKTPGLAEWAESFVADEAVKDVMPETEKLIEFAKIIFAKMKPAA